LKEFTFQKAVFHFCTKQVTFLIWIFFFPRNIRCCHEGFTGIKVTKTLLLCVVGVVCHTCANYRAVCLTSSVVRRWIHRWQFYSVIMSSHQLPVLLQSD